jgi:hypothetical protein
MERKASPPELKSRFALKLYVVMPVFLGVLLFFSGCTSPRLSATSSKKFSFQADTFDFANELVWAYRYDENGRWTGYPRQPKPEYTHHCFVVARATRQFFSNARFDPSQPVVSDDVYRRLIRQVISSNPRKVLPEHQKVVIPGYSDLRRFSQAKETLLKSECGGAWQSYFQRGHWRMLFPFSRSHQERTAHRLGMELATGKPVVVHIVKFPQLTINHAVVLFEANATATEIQFLVYDPNQPARPTSIVYDRATQTFLFASNDYFPGGKLDVYEIYHKWNY